MAILVVFGNSGAFGMSHGDLVSGNSGDSIYFADDREYKGDDKNIDLPKADNETRLLVLLHNSKSDNHASQLNWLKRVNNYNPTNPEYFSHIPGTEPYETLKHLFNNPSQNQDADLKNQISSFVQKNGNRAILKDLDNCAAWNALYLFSKLGEHKKKMIDYLDKLPADISYKLNHLDNDNWLPTLEIAAASYCQDN